MHLNRIPSAWLWQAQALQQSSGGRTNRWCTQSDCVSVVLNTCEQKWVLLIGIQALLKGTEYAKLEATKMFSWFGALQSRTKESNGDRTRAQC